MRLSEKLILFVLAAAVIPLSAVGLLLLKQAETQLAQRIAQEQRAVAAAAAESVANEVMTAINAMATSALAIDWQAATADEARGGLRLVYAQSALVAQVALVQPGNDFAPTVAGADGHPAPGESAPSSWFPYESLGEHGERGQIAIAPVTGGVLPLAIQVGAKERRAQFIAAQLALRPLSSALLKHSTDGAGDVGLYDAERHLIAQTGAAAERPGRLQALMSGEQTLRTADGERVAIAAVPERLGLSVLVAVDEERALEPVRRLRQTVLFGIGGTLVLLVIAALLFTRSLNRRIDVVASAAVAYGRGELGTRVTLGGADELAQLAHTFNAMGSELEAARTRLTRWNDELKQRVEEATADLKAAQAQLLEAQKLAAIGQLGAGVAHEINNPLCGILGNAQLMLLDRLEGSDEFDMLKKIEEGAKRCRDITQNLLRFSQTQGAVSLRPTELNAVVRSALALEQHVNEEQGITVKAQLAPAPIEVMADPEQLAQVIAALVSNARTAMAKAAPKTLTVSTRVGANGPEIEVHDTGKGISTDALPRIFEPFFTTKDVWSNIGLGLSVAYRVITEHHGHIVAVSEAGKGATFTVTLPPFDPNALRTAKAASSAVTVGGQGVGVVR